jgi:ribonuclease VapC
LTVLDSSAVIAIFLNEPGARDLEAAMNMSASLAIGAPSVLEVAMVLQSRRPRRDSPNLDAFIDSWRIEIVSFDVAQLAVAREAFRRYGRGSGSKARLNFGDCCAYALAKVRDEPLLFVGDDFSHTDIVSAI